MNLLRVAFCFTLLFSSNSWAEDQSRISYDLYASFGQYADVNYTEAQLGLNYFIKDWLIWRNALFGRFPSEGDNDFGLDTSMRARHIMGTDSGSAGVLAFAGAGYRFASESENLPFTEGGIVFGLGGIRLGGGAKVFFHNNRPLLTDGSRASATEVQYFIVLSGGGVL